MIEFLELIAGGSIRLPSRLNNILGMEEIMPEEHNEQVCFWCHIPNSEEKLILHQGGVILLLGHHLTFTYMLLLCQEHSAEFIDRTYGPVDTRPAHVWEGI